MRRLARFFANRLLRFREQEDAGAWQVPVTADSQPRLLYIHIPFCEHLCPYCSFHRIRYNPATSDEYFQALRHEIETYADAGYAFSDVYVGGGTPTVNLPGLLDTLSLVRSRFSIGSISIETNPNHLDDACCAALKDAGVDRLSVGVQSFDDRQLERMGRLQAYGSSEVILERLIAIRDVFPTLNIDMMFNLPGQTMADLDRDIDTVIASGVNQVSFYPLMASDAVIARITREMGQFSYHNEKDMYSRIRERMSPTHPPSSVWCFSKEDGLIDEYLVDHEQFIGAGSGAFSFVDGALYATSFSILNYHQQLGIGVTGISRKRQLSPLEQKMYWLLRRLFGTRVTLEELQGAGLGPVFAILRVFGLIQRQREHFQLTPRGYYFMVVAMSEFLNSVNNLRDEMRAGIPGELAASYGEPVKLQGL